MHVLPEKSVDNVECAGVNCMRLLKFSLIIGGKGKVTVYDLKETNYNNK